jgi:F-type H+-transporting ATPase subunit delta
MTSTRRVKRSARALYRFCLLDGVLDADRARLVAGRLARSRRRGALPVLSGFLRLVRLDRAGHTALIESAGTLPESVRAQVEAGLARTYGASLDATFAENPGLIGGLRIKVGSDVYDGSVRGKLAALAARL